MGCGTTPKKRFYQTLEKIKKLKHVEVADINLEKQPFYELLQGIASSKEIEMFTLRNVDIEGIYP